MKLDKKLVHYKPSGGKAVQWNIYISTQIPLVTHTNLNSQYHLFTIFVSLPLAIEYQIMVGCSFVVLSSLLHFAAATSFFFAVDAVVVDFFSIVVAVVDLFFVINLLCSFLGEM